MDLHKFTHMPQRPGQGHPAPTGAAARTLRNYKIGFAAIGVFTLVIAVMAIMLATGTKQDAETEKKASRAATALNDYITKNRQLPESLKDAGVSDAGPNVTYKKLSDERYRFCATYKTESDGYSSLSMNPVEDAVVRGLYGGSFSSSGSYYSSSSSSTEESYLYVSSAHKKGENCQTIRPYEVDGSSYQFDDSTLDTSEYDFDEDAAPSVLSDPKEAAMASAEQDTVCYISGYASHYSAEVMKVETADGGPVVPTTTQDIILTLKPHEKAPELTLTLKKGEFNVFDRDCTGQTISSFKKGDHVTVFFGNDDSYMLDAVVNFSRSSY